MTPANYVPDLLLPAVGAVCFLLGIAVEKFSHWLHDNELEIDLSTNPVIKLRIRGQIQ